MLQMFFRTLSHSNRITVSASFTLLRHMLSTSCAALQMSNHLLPNSLVVLLVHVFSSPGSSPRWFTCSESSPGRRHHLLLLHVFTTQFLIFFLWGGWIYFCCSCSFTPLSPDPKGSPARHEPRPPSTEAPPTQKNHRLFPLDFGSPAAAS